MRRRWLTIAVILTVPSGCDNVRWGGVDVRLQPPTAQVPAPTAEVQPADSEPALAPITEPFLLAGTRSGDSASLVVVGTVAGDSLKAFPADSATAGFGEQVAKRMLTSGTDLVLFSEGVRVGRLAVASVALDSSFCVPRPRVSGLVELVPKAAGANRFLALPASVAARRHFGQYETFDNTYDQRVASLNLASAAIPKLGATWPTSVLEARADIQALQLADTDAFAATFLVKDRLDVAPPQDGAYSLFLMGTSSPDGYRQSYLAYRTAADQGKGDPRYFDHLDWNGDGSEDILLDVLGAHSRWFATLGRREGSWLQTFQDPCGAPGAGH